VLEWVIGDKAGVPHYVASAALPLAGIDRMIARRKARLPYPSRSP
jgi:hypothetical protein